MNISKSSILFSKNITASSINSINDIIPYKATSLAPYYLGLPLIIGKSKEEAFQPIVEKVVKKITRWKAKTLSQAGRTVLLKATASAILAYTMSTVLLPDLICNNLDKVFKDFWWGFPKDKARNLSLKSWSFMCIPKSQGGLGLHKMKAMNLAVIAKLGWKSISHHNSCWVQQFHAKYIRYGDFFSTYNTTNAFMIWKGILKSKSLLSSNAYLQVSKFSNLPIWTTSWILTLPSFKPIPKHPFNQSMPSLLISDQIHPVSLNWRTPLIEL